MPEDLADRVAGELSEAGALAGADRLQALLDRLNEAGVTEWRRKTQVRENAGLVTLALLRTYAGLEGNQDAVDGCTVRSVVWPGSHLRGVTLRRCTFNDVVVRRTDLTATRFLRCDIHDTVFLEPRIARESTRLELQGIEATQVLGIRVPDDDTTRVIYDPEVIADTLKACGAPLRPALPQGDSRVSHSYGAHSRFPGAVCRQRWTVRLGEVEPVFGQTGRVVLDITARTAHDGALKWTRAPSTPRAARSIFATFPSTCALPSGGRWSLRRVLQRPGRQRKRSSAKSSCGPSRTSSSAPSSPPCCNARCAPPRLATRRAPSCATCPGGCGATAWRRSNVRTSRGTTVPVTTPYYRRETRPSGEAEAGTLPRLGGAGHLRPVHAEAGLRGKPRGRHAQLAGRSAGAAPLRRHRPGYQDPPLDRLSLRCAGPSGPAERGVRVCWTA